MTTLAARTEDMAVGRGATSKRWWAVAGIPAVVGGVGGVAFFDTERSMATQDVRLRLCAAFGFVGVAGLVAFVAGLRRYLDGQTPAGSLTGPVAQFGGYLMAATLFLTYLVKLTVSDNTHRITGSSDVIVRNALDELTTGAWAALALVMFAVTVAALRHAALPRWLGWASAVVASLIAVATVAGAPAAGYLPGAVWLLVISVALAWRRST
jgi:hypothetical protein